MFMGYFNATLVYNTYICDGVKVLRSNPPRHAMPQALAGESYPAPFIPFGVSWGALGRDRTHNLLVRSRPLCAPERN